MRTKLSLLILSLFLFPALSSAQSSTPADETAIRNIEVQWETAWNHHNVAAMVRTYAPDSDAVNLAGEWFKGRPAFEKSLEDLHSGKVKGSVWHTERTDIRFLTPEIAIVHVHVSSHGDLNPDGSPMPPRHVILTRVEMKRDGRWLIVASQATNIVPRASAMLTGATSIHAGN